ncbi:hypothetical protein WDV85_12030 [Pseudokineococcus sp. 5B2Z-1]|uniref:hypothetical protein n=1 Tax=Pseudokineococcus sp. 5B2Z-1 TaxID=3132744 RepID=UPI003099DA60
MSAPAQPQPPSSRRPRPGRGAPEPAADPHETPAGAVLVDPAPSSRGTAARAGAVAALVKAATYLLGLGLVGLYLAPRGFVEAQGDPEASLAFLLEHRVLLHLWYLALYLVGGGALVVLVLAVHQRLRGAAGGLALPTATATATALGLVWAGLLLASGLVALVGQSAVADLAVVDRDLAVATWSSVVVVQDALGGGVEVVGAAWVFLVGVLALRSGRLGRSLGVVGVGLGVVGALTLVPAAADVAATAFGLVFIAWFVLAAVELLRTRP